MIQSKQIKAPTTKNENAEVIDIFYDLTEVTKKFKPIFENAIHDAKEEPQLTQYEKEELKF